MWSWLKKKQKKKKHNTIEDHLFQRRNWAVRDHKTLVRHVIRLLQAYPVIILSTLPCSRLKKGAVSRNRILQPSHDVPSATSHRTKCQLSGCSTRWSLWPKEKKGFPCLRAGAVELMKTPLCATNNLFSHPKSVGPSYLNTTLSMLKARWVVWGEDVLIRRERSSLVD